MRISEQIKSKARRMIIQEGRQQKEVAKTLNVSEKTICAWIKKYGWRNNADARLYQDKNPLLGYLKFLETTYPATYTQIQKTFTHFLTMQQNETNTTIKSGR